MVINTSTQAPCLRTRLTELLGVEYPVMLAGMGGVSYWKLCSAVSQAGGFGCLGAAVMSPEKLRQELGKVRQVTDKPIGVNLLAAMPGQIERSVDTLVENKVRLLVSGLGIPRDAIDLLHAGGVRVAAVCGQRKHAQRAVDSGCDLVIAQGTEAGGHTGSIATMALVPAVVDAVGRSVPVVAAGGIADGRGLAAALSLGADGVWVGTRFAASQEARRLEGYHEALVAKTEADTVITRAYSGKTMRVLANQWTAHFEVHPEEIQPFPQQREHAVQQGATHLGASEGASVDPAIEGYLCGQSVGMIHDILPAGDIVRSMVRQAIDVLRSLEQRTH